jgi:hypothetical protein
VPTEVTIKAVQEWVLAVTLIVLQVMVEHLHMADQLVHQIQVMDLQIPTDMDLPIPVTATTTIITAVTGIIMITGIVLEIIQITCGNALKTVCLMRGIT